MDRVVILWVRNSSGSGTAGSCTLNGEIWLEIKGGEERVLSWRGDGLGDDPFADGGETSVPMSGMSVVTSGAKRTCGNEIGTEEASTADGMETGRGVLVVDF